MKLFKDYVLIKKSELNDELRSVEKSTYKKAEEAVRKDFQNEIEALGDKLDNKKAEVKSLTKKNRELTTEVEVLTEDRDDVREVMKLKIEVEDQEALLTAVKERQDIREAKLKDRETKVGLEEEGEYKRGYADGVSDGVRKITEITQADRDNAMKIAMVAAASHSSPEVIKAVADGTKALSSGLTDQEG